MVSYETEILYHVVQMCMFTRLRYYTMWYSVDVYITEILFHVVQLRIFT